MRKRACYFIAMTAIFAADVVMLPQARMHGAEALSAFPQWVAGAISIMFDSIALPMLIALYFCSLGELFLVCSIVDFFRRNSSG